ncbi:MAG: hypothetical protein KDA91_18725, partial [Planctomycetaceae bacterium]|nr:hypothetical protein [Planctomycetaceae bacterium]
TQEFAHNAGKHHFLTRETLPCTGFPAKYTSLCEPFEVDFLSEPPGIEQSTSHLSGAKMELQLN